MAGRFSVEAVFEAKDRMTRPVARMTKRIERMARNGSRSIRRLDRAFSGAHRTIARTGAVVGAAALAATLALTALGKSGADFEQAITNVGAVGLQTRAQIAPLEKMALDLGATTKFTATEAAGAMEIMARSGFSAADILAGVPGVLNAAAASGLEIAEVADHVSNALKGMGLATSDATRVADVLALASSRTNSTIGTLGESLRNVASTARVLGVPLEDVVASVALLQDVGLDASVAGSAMNTMLTKLAKPPAAIAKQMKRLGLSFKDAQGNMKAFPEVLATVNTLAKKSGGSMDRVAILADLVGLRGQKAASNLAKLFETGKVEKLTAELRNATGAAQEMAELRMDTLQGDLTLLGSAVDGLTVALFGLKGGALRDVVQLTTKWVSANKDPELRNATGAAQEMAELRMDTLQGDLTLLGSAVDGLTVALFGLKGGALRDVVQLTTKWVSENKGLIVSGVQDFLQGVADNMPAIVRGLKLIGGGLAVFYTWAAAAKVAAAATWLLTAAATAPITPFGLVAAAVSALAVVAFAFWDDIGPVVEGALASITAALSSAWAWLKSSATAVAEFVVGAFVVAFPGISAMAAATWNLVRESWEPATEFFGGVWDTVLDKTTRFVRQIISAFEPVTRFFEQLWAGISSGFDSAVGWIVDTLGALVGDVRQRGREVLDGPSGAFSGPQGAPMSSPQVVGPQERAARAMSHTITESLTFERNQSEITIRDESGRAEVTRQPRNGPSLRFAESGAL